MPQYYVQNSHPAIIEPDVFDAVQAEMERRKRLGRRCTCDSVFSTKIVCGDCGGFYGPKVWNSNQPYRKVIWRCNEKYHGEKKCETPHITEDELKRRFLTAFNTLMGSREELLENCRLAQKTLCDCAALDQEIENLRREQQATAELARQAIHENARSAVHGTGGDGCLQRYTDITERLTGLEAKREKLKEKSRVLGKFIRDIQNQPLVLEEFDEMLWTAIVDHVTVLVDRQLRFFFKDGSDIYLVGVENSSY